MNARASRSKASISSRPTCARLKRVRYSCGSSKQAASPETRRAITKLFPMLLRSHCRTALLRTFSRRGELRRALAADVKRLLGKSAVPSPPDVQPDLAPEVLSKHRLAAIEKREAFQARLTQQEERRAAGEIVWNLHDNESYAQSGAPELSIVITLFNYAHYLGDCLGSIIQAAAQLPDAPEIVIVNDASTDDSLAQARNFQRRSSLPTRIVDKHFNTGLADARNVGIDLARAPFIFMMDADNLIFPNALRAIARRYLEGGLRGGLQPALPFSRHAG